MTAADQQFTAKQISNWGEFEHVRTSGCYNMFDDSARQAASLSKDEYSFTMKNFSALQEAATKAKV